MHLNLLRNNLVLITVVLAFPMGAFAQAEFTIGSIIRGFELPQTGQDGKLQSKISGEEALVVSSNQIRINGLQIDIYNDAGEPTTQISSPECTYWQMEDRLTTEKEIHVQRPGMDITAKGMEWEMGQSRGMFRDDVKVIVKTMEPAL